MKDQRIVQVYENGTWIQIDFDKLREGDRFRMVGEDGKQHIDGRGHKEWIASSKPYKKFDDWVIDVLI